MLFSNAACPKPPVPTAAYFAVPWGCVWAGGSHRSTLGLREEKHFLCRSLNLSPLCSQEGQIDKRSLDQAAVSHAHGCFPGSAMSPGTFPWDTTSEAGSTQR